MLITLPVALATVPVCLFDELMTDTSEEPKARQPLTEDKTNHENSRNIRACRAFSNFSIFIAYFFSDERSGPSAENCFANAEEIRKRRPTLSRCARRH